MITPANNSGLSDDIRKTGLTSPNERLQGRGVRSWLNRKGGPNTQTFTRSSLRTFYGFMITMTAQTDIV